VTDYELGDRGSIPDRGIRLFSLSPRPDRLWGPASCTTGTRGTLPGRGVMLTTHLHSKQSSRKGGAISPLLPYVFMAWCLYQGQLYFTSKGYTEKTKKTIGLKSEIWGFQGCKYEDDSRCNIPEDSHLQMRNILTWNSSYNEKDYNCSSVTTVVPCEGFREQNTHTHTHTHTVIAGLRSTGNKREREDLQLMWSEYCNIIHV
jgi:hypothetical protein